MTELMTTDVRVLIDREPFDAAAMADLIEVLGRDPSRYVILRDAAQAIAEREKGKMKPSTHLRLGVADCLLGRYKSALEHLSKAGDSGLASFYQGVALENLQRWAEAGEAYAAAAQAGYDPKRSELKRVGTLRRQGRLDEARQLLEKLAGQSGSVAEYHYQRGSMLAAAGDLLPAAEAFEKALEIDPTHTGALFELAYINDLYDNDDRAIELYQQCTSRPPVPVAALINLGILYEDQHRYKEAEECYRRVLQTYPTHPRARLFAKDVAASKDMYYDEDNERISDQMRKLMEIPVTDFELSVRSRNCLKKMNIRTLGDLTRTTEAALLASKNFGETSLTEIKEMMRSKGLELGMALGGGERGGLPGSGPAAAPAYEDVSPEERALLAKPITDLALSVRARKCMTRLNIQTVGQLIQRTGDELLEIKNFGVTSLNEVRDKLAQLGLKLKGD
ncbi:MAG: RNA polymerase subunit alpha domain protein [Isosphaeraceae bacterium]|jgi:DNA-directed RNA polymerase subunit alpha|nr:MAG: RNA polymerase subunit alpha domain protein [Isosphaeraceae bacterium]